MSVGPALGAGNNGNANGNGNGNGNGANGDSPSGSSTSGNVKVHDAGTGLETSGSDNEPHVCAFWLGFTFDAPFEAGTWVLVSWAPTGDGSTVASGAYDTSGDGADSSSVIEVAAGHYRVEWAATGASSSKKKTFWVDAGCDETPADEPPAEEPAPPAEDPGTPSDEPPTEEPAPPVEEAIQLVEGQLTVPSEESDDEEPAAPVEEPAVEEPAVEEPAVAPSVESPATPADVSSEEYPAQAEDPGAAETGTLPAHGERASVTGVGEPTMSDTATATLAAPSGLLATIGMLLVIAVHAIARRRPFGRDGMATDA